MTTLHVTSDFNVEASLNAAFASALAAFTMPAYLSAPAVVYEWAEITASLPCFSIVHFTNALSSNYQGQMDGAGASTVRASGLMEISAWVSRDQKYSGQDIWVARLRFMESMIASAFISNKIVGVKDYSVTPGTPTSTTYNVKLNNLDFVQVAQDTNPAIERRKALISYFWDLRA